MGMSFKSLSYAQSIGEIDPDNFTSIYMIN